MIRYQIAITLVLGSERGGHLGLGLFRRRRQGAHGELQRLLHDAYQRSELNRTLTQSVARIACRGAVAQALAHGAGLEGHRQTGGPHPARLLLFDGQAAIAFDNPREAPTRYRFGGTIHVPPFVNFDRCERDQLALPFDEVFDHINQASITASLTRQAERFLSRKRRLQQRDASLTAVVRSFARRVSRPVSLRLTPEHELYVSATEVRFVPTPGWTRSSPHSGMACMGVAMAYRDPAILGSMTRLRTSELERGAILPFSDILDAIPLSPDRLEGELIDALAAAF